MHWIKTFVIYGSALWILDKSLQQLISLQSVKQVPSLKNSTLCAFHVGDQSYIRKGEGKGRLQYINRAPRPLSRDKFWGGNKSAGGVFPLNIFFQKASHDWGQCQSCRAEQCKVQTDIALSACRLTLHCAFCCQWFLLTVHCAEYLYCHPRLVVWLRCAEYCNRSVLWGKLERPGSKINVTLNQIWPLHLCV